MHSRFAIGAAALAALLSPSCGDSPLSISAQRGHKIFMQTAAPSCATCHTFKHAGSTAVLGVNLDKLSYSRKKIVLAVRQGVGVMPSQKTVLNETQINDVASYVMEAYGREPGE